MTTLPTTEALTAADPSSAAAADLCRRIAALEAQVETGARAVAESDGRFRNMADHAPVMMWVTRPDGYCTYLNRRWHEFTGQTEAQARGYGWLDATHPDDRAMAEDAFLSANAAQAAFQVEYRLRRADGVYRWAIDAASPRFSDDGAFLGYVGSVLDIDERREMEQRLRDSEDHYRHAVELNPQTTWTADPDGQLDRVNHRWFEWTGTTGLGDSWANGLHQDDRMRTFEVWGRSVATGEPYDVEHRVRMRDGGYRWMWSRAFSRWDHGRIVKWYGTTEDVNDSKLAETALRELNADLERQVVERARERGRTWAVSPDLLSVVTPDGRFESVNPAWAALGWSEAELRAAPLFTLVHPDDLEKTYAGMAVLSQGEPVLGFENRYRQADGLYRWLSWVAVPEEGKYYCSARDVTSEKEQADALRKTEEKLRQSQKMDAVGQLTGGVAHDFNNLLTVIRGSVDLLRRPDLPEERRQRYVEAISDTVTRAATLTGQLLAFARRQALQPEVFDVGRSVSAVSDMMGTLTGARIEVETRLPDAPCCISADPSQFDTALVNMAVNARDAMGGEGRLTVTVRAMDGIPASRSHAAVPGDFVAVSLADTGPGVPEDRIDQIFEPFFTTKGVGEGTGLGLSQVHGFVKQSGGDVRVESEPGSGATFTLYLPRVSGEDRPTATEVLAGPEPLMDGRGARVLVVEDNPDVGAFATRTLRELGYKTTLAVNAEAALALLAEGHSRFDVVFSDVVMPGMSGLELGQEIRRLYADMPVVLASGYSHVIARNGTYGFELLQKPYSMDQLSRVLSKAAHARNRRRSAAG